MIKLASDLTAGTLFPSPRFEEGVVKVICDYGKCTHDPSRHDSVHVRGSGGSGNDWFIALVDREVIHCCSTWSCWMDNPTITQQHSWESEPREVPHRSANAHAQ